jgi:hypothetical protein
MNSQVVVSYGRGYQCSLPYLLFILWVVAGESWLHFRPKKMSLSCSAGLIYSHVSYFTCSLPLASRNSYSCPVPIIAAELRYVIFDIYDQLIMS